MMTLLIQLQEAKKPDYLRMALREVARQIEAGAVAGLVHGEPWALKAQGERLGVDSPFVETTTYNDGSHIKHCGFCGMHLQSYSPPPEVN